MDLDERARKLLETPGGRPLKQRLQRVAARLNPPAAFRRDVPALGFCDLPHITTFLASRSTAQNLVLTNETIILGEVSSVVDDGAVVLVRGAWQSAAWKSSRTEDATAAVGSRSAEAAVAASPTTAASPAAPSLASLRDMLRPMPANTFAFLHGSYAYPRGSLMGCSSGSGKRDGLTIALPQGLGPGELLIATVVSVRVDGQASISLREADCAWAVEALHAMLGQRLGAAQLRALAESLRSIPAAAPPASLPTATEAPRHTKSVNEAMAAQRVFYHPHAGELGARSAPRRERLSPPRPPRPAPLYT